MWRDVGGCSLRISRRGWRAHEGIACALLFYRRFRAVTGDDDRGAGQREQAVADRARDCFEGPAPKIRAADRPAEERVAGEDDGGLAGALEGEAERAWRGPGRVQRAGR